MSRTFKMNWHMALDMTVAIIECKPHLNTATEHSPILVTKIVKVKFSPVVFIIRVRFAKTNIISLITNHDDTVARFTITIFGWTFVTQIIRYLPMLTFISVNEWAMHSQDSGHSAIDRLTTRWSGNDSYRFLSSFWKYTTPCMHGTRDRAPLLAVHPTMGTHA